MIRICENFHFQVIITQCIHIKWEGIQELITLKLTELQLLDTKISK